MITVAAVYHFIRITDPGTLADRLRPFAQTRGVRGSLILAHEGVNGTIAGARGGILAVLAKIQTELGVANLDWKESSATQMPFKRLKVRVKREIVTMGQPDLDVRNTGTYVTPAEWNELICAPDVAVIDTRNDYEVAIGTFDSAVDPATATFSDFPAWWDANKERFRNKRIAMFCTGGIRCEKSTAFLKSQGVEDIFHLRGGILKYLEEMPEADSLWRGACFVFDERVAVGHGLRELPYSLCRACGRPLTPGDLKHKDYEKGVSCRSCRGTYTDSDRARFRERQRQYAAGEVSRAD